MEPKEFTPNEDPNDRPPYEPPQVRTLSKEDIIAELGDASATSIFLLPLT